MNDDTSNPAAFRQTADFERRFGGIARLYGRRALSGFQRSHVCVIGIGGVGSWAVEAMARSGIGALTLIDLDHISESNINRQVHALEPDFGMAKVAAMGRRIADINPQCRVTAVEEFVTPGNVCSLLDVEHVDYVLECTDQPLAKAAIAGHVRASRCPMIAIGGTGGQRDPTRIRVGDLSRTVHDPLLAKTRRLLRRHYGFPRRGLMGVRCVYSLEQARYPQPDGSVGAVRAGFAAGTLHCGGLGSATHVTASFGFVAVARVLDDLAERAVPESYRDTAESVPA
ncbi:MAG: tRNA threonylcarbamoyladenosine dehydratase [Arenicellales bacterium]